MQADAQIYAKLKSEKHNPAHIKYLSHDSCPANLNTREWEHAPVVHYSGTFYWFKRKDVGDWQPHYPEE